MNVTSADVKLHVTNANMSSTSHNTNPPNKGDSNQIKTTTRHFLTGNFGTFAIGDSLRALLRRDRRGMFHPSITQQNHSLESFKRTLYGFVPPRVIPNPNHFHSSQNIVENTVSVKVVPKSCDVACQTSRDFNGNDKGIQTDSCDVKDSQTQYEDVTALDLLQENIQRQESVLEEMLRDRPTTATKSSGFVRLGKRHRSFTLDTVNENELLPESFAVFRKVRVGMAKMSKLTEHQSLRARYERNHKDMVEKNNIINTFLKHAFDVWILKTMIDGPTPLISRYDTYTDLSTFEFNEISTISSMSIDEETHTDQLNDAFDNDTITDLSASSGNLNALEDDGDASADVGELCKKDVRYYLEPISLYEDDRTIVDDVLESNLDSPSLDKTYHKVMHDDTTTLDQSKLVSSFQQMHANSILSTITEEGTLNCSDVTKMMDASDASNICQNLSSIDSAVTSKELLAGSLNCSDVTKMMDASDASNICQNLSPNDSAVTSKELLAGSLNCSDVTKMMDASDASNICQNLSPNDSAVTSKELLAGFEDASGDMRKDLAESVFQARSSETGSAVEYSLLTHDDGIEMVEEKLKSWHMRLISLRENGRKNCNSTDSAQTSDEARRKNCNPTDSAQTTSDEAASACVVDNKDTDDPQKFDNECDQPQQLQTQLASSEIEDSANISVLNNDAQDCGEKILNCEQEMCNKENIVDDSSADLENNERSYLVKNLNEDMSISVVEMEQKDSINSEFKVQSCISANISVLNNDAQDCGEKILNCCPDSAVSTPEMCDKENIVDDSSADLGNNEQSCLDKTSNESISMSHKGDNISKSYDAEVIEIEQEDSVNTEFKGQSCSTDGNCQEENLGEVISVSKENSGNISKSLNENVQILETEETTIADSEGCLKHEVVVENINLSQEVTENICNLDDVPKNQIKSCCKDPIPAKEINISPEEEKDISKSSDSKVVDFESGDTNEIRVSEVDVSQEPEMSCSKTTDDKAANSSTVCANISLEQLERSKGSECEVSEIKTVDSHDSHQNSLEIQSARRVSFEPRDSAVETNNDIFDIQHLHSSVDVPCDDFDEVTVSSLTSDVSFTNSMVVMVGDTLDRTFSISDTDSINIQSDQEVYSDQGFEERHDYDEDSNDKNIIAPVQVDPNLPNGETDSQSDDSAGPESVLLNAMERGEIDVNLNYAQPLMFDSNNNVEVADNVYVVEMDDLPHDDFVEVVENPSAVPLVPPENLASDQPRLSELSALTCQIRNEVLNYKPDANLPDGESFEMRPSLVEFEALEQISDIGNDENDNVGSEILNHVGQVINEALGSVNSCIDDLGDNQDVFGGFVRLVSTVDANLVVHDELLGDVSVVVGEALDTVNSCINNISTKEEKQFYDPDGDVDTSALARSKSLHDLSNDNPNHDFNTPRADKLRLSGAFRRSKSDHGTYRNNDSGSDQQKFAKCFLTAPKKRKQTHRLNGKIVELSQPQHIRLGISLCQQRDLTPSRIPRRIITKPKSPVSTSSDESNLEVSSFISRPSISGSSSRLWVSFKSPRKSSSHSRASGSGFRNRDSTMSTSSPTNQIYVKGDYVAVPYSPSTKHDRTLDSTLESIPEESRRRLSFSNCDTDDDEDVDALAEGDGWYVRPESDKIWFNEDVDRNRERVETQVKLIEDQAERLGMVTGEIKAQFVDNSDDSFRTALSQTYQNSEPECDSSCRDESLGMRKVLY